MRRTDGETGLGEVKRGGGVTHKQPGPTVAPLRLPSPRPFPFVPNSLRGRFGEEANILQPSHEVTGNAEGASRETGSGMC